MVGVGVPSGNTIPVRQLKNSSQSVVGCIKTKINAVASP